MRLPTFVLGTTFTLLASTALAQPSDPSGIDFVTIGAPGNAAWEGRGQNDRAVGRGTVSYEYRIGRFEVTTSQWVEFFNAAYDRPAADRLPFLTPPTFWGATGATPNTPGGLRWSVPAGNEMRFVGNISWRMAAMYCNWLHNDKSSDRTAFLNGAYDVSTFGYNGNVFTDQLTHNPDAKFWIPTWDEWLKAAHYDPNRNGQGQGGWWTYSNGTNVQLLAGPPGIGQANYGFSNGTEGLIPLGAYSNVQSPWGLFDMAGATMEWTEEAPVGAGGQRLNRILDGSMWGSSLGFGAADAIYGQHSEFPSINLGDMGFRIASAIPSPGTGVLSIGLLLTAGCRRSRCSATPA